MAKQQTKYVVLKGVEVSAPGDAGATEAWVPVAVESAYKPEDAIKVHVEGQNPIREGTFRAVPRRNWPAHPVRATLVTEPTLKLEAIGDGQVVEERDGAVEPDAEASTDANAAGTRVAVPAP